MSPRRGKKLTLKICNRFHFSSALKRMSCIVSQSGASGPTYLGTVKGAPEVLRDMFKQVPADYDSVHTKLARHGARVLALGHKNLGSLSMREVRALVCVGGGCVYVCVKTLNILIFLSQSVHL